MQSVGAAWLMVSLNAGPMYVALIQTASALPFFLLSLPAGAVGDILDRRKIILGTETWMIAVASLVAGLTLAGLMSPLLLLILTFALSSGDAFESPTWRAVPPELVEKEDLPAASALNGIEFNFARAIGPALAGAVVAAARGSSGKRLTEDELRAFIKKCPPFNMMMLGVCVAQFHRAVRDHRLESAYKDVGLLDLLSAIYFPYCNRFVTRDTGQYKALCDLVRFAGLETQVITYEEFRRLWLVAA
jgi:MFS family permease